MTDGAYDGAVVFEPLPGGRETVKLGRLPVGEIGPVPDPSSNYPYYWGLTLPWAMSMMRMEPAHSADDARKKVARVIGAWLQLAGLRPVECSDAE